MITQMTNGGDFESDSSKGGEKWLDPRGVLQIQLKDLLVDCSLDTGYKREESKNVCVVFSSNRCKDGLTSERGKEIGLMEFGQKGQV